MLFECFDRTIDLRRLIDVQDVPASSHSEHRDPHYGMRLILDGLSTPYDIRINRQNPGQATRLAMARRQLEQARRGVAQAVVPPPKHTDDRHRWRDVIFDLGDIVLVEHVQRQEKVGYGKTRARGLSMSVTLRYAIHATTGIHVHAICDFEERSTISLAGGMDFELASCCRPGRSTTSALRGGRPDEVESRDDTGRAVLAHAALDQGHRQMGADRAL